MSDPNNSEPNSADLRARPDDRNSMHDNWPGIPVAGLIIVAVGVLFLAGNFGLNLPLPNRWWAIFILLPAAGALVAAARFSRIDGGLSSRVAGAATSGMLMLATALILFLGLDWGKVWPVMVIIVGLGIVARGYRPR